MATLHLGCVQTITTMTDKSLTYLSILMNLVIDLVLSLRVPTACRDLRPINLIEEAIPKIGQLPDGVSIVYDVKSHVHALQFMKETNEIIFPAKRIFKNCQYLPEEFSVFFVLSHEKMFSKNECIFTVRQSNKIYISVNISRRKLTFIFNDRKVDFKTSAFRDNRWHTVGFSVTGSSVVMTTDCLKLRRRKLRRTFPSYLDINNSTISIAKCDSSNSVLQGLLKDIILVPGADVARRACPPRVARSAFLDNRIPTVPDKDLVSYDTVGPNWEDCTWMDVGNLAFDVYSRSIKVCVNGIWKQVSLQFSAEQRRKQTLDYLELYQEILTPAAAIDIELFHIPGEGLFAVFANSDSGGGRNRGVSGLYKWVEKNFRLYQRLPTVSAQSWCHFKIGNNIFLAVANYGNGSQELTNSTIFKWHRHRKKFREYQWLPTYTARDMEHFEINDDHFLAVANHAKGTNQVVDSTVLKWNTKSRKFEQFQQITTVGAYDWTYFSVRGYQFLAIAQAFNGLTTLMESVIYVFQKDTFVPFQTLETNGATDFEFFTIDDEAYLAVANAYNYGPQNFKDIDTFRTNSTIYRLDIGKRAFQKWQTFQTNSAIDWEHFKIGGDNYLVVSNAQNGGTDTERLTTIYRLQGVDKFVPVHQMYLEPNADWETFQDGDDHFLIFSNAKGRSSSILKAKLK